MSDPTQITQEVRALERLDLEGLRAVWTKRFGPAPRLRSPELLRLALAWRIQTQYFGGLDAATRRRLRTGAGVGRSDHVSVGVIITKEWRGQIYEVARTEQGYVWDGRMFRSLSGVAEAITGVKRNGPCFFGLRPDEAP